MIKAGIIGSTGYAGGELVRILSGHKDVKVIWLGSKSYVGQSYAKVYPNMSGVTGDVCKEDDIAALANEADVIFTATPQGLCSSMVSEDILRKTRIIDLSADFRLKDVSVYEKWYGIKHESPKFLPEAVYGLCEINRSDVKGARLVANPGCYTTCSILTVYPLAKEKLIDMKSLVIDAISGASGAGRGAKTENLFCEINENVKAYKVASHRHTPEIEEQLSYASGEDVRLSFTPHLAPFNRGILVTAYASLKEGVTGENIREAYEKYYGDERFIRLLGEGVCPETRWVEASNYVDIGYVVDGRTGRVIMMGALDNLIKGAAGQAVQNMNIMFGLDEAEGIGMAPMFP